ncbi:MAG: ABC transporter permease [Thermofilaceae archaeon]
MGAGRFIVKTGIRLLATYVVVIVLYFVVVRILPVLAAGGDVYADPVLVSFKRAEEDPKLIEWAREGIKLYGLDKPLFPDQLIVYLGSVLTFQFGTSFYSQRPVVTEIAVRLPYTLSFYTITTILPIIIGFYLGVTAAKHRGKRLDSIIIQTSTVSRILPGWLVLLIIYYSLAYIPIVYWNIQIFPLPVRPPEIGFKSWGQFLYLIWYMSPMLLAALIAWSGGWIYYIRQLVVSEMGQDYYLTALAKGFDEKIALRKHVIPNVRPPIVMSLAYTIPDIFGGAVIFEIIANWPGIASFSYLALQTWDFPVLSAFFSISVMLNVISLFVAELILLLIDPRVRVGG